MKTFFNLFAFTILGVIMFLIGITLGDIPVSSPEPTRQVQTYESSQPSNSKAVQAAIDEGYTDVQSQGVAFLGCGKDDSMITSEHVLAKNSNGKTLELTVCCGLIFKGCTVRH